MNTRKAAMRIAFICLKVAMLVLIVLGTIYLGQTTYQYSRAVFSDAAYEEEPGKNAKISIPQDISEKDFAEIRIELFALSTALWYNQQGKKQRK